MSANVAGVAAHFPISTSTTPSIEPTVRAEISTSYGRRFEYKGKASDNFYWVSLFFFALTATFLIIGLATDMNGFFYAALPCGLITIGTCCICSCDCCLDRMSASRQRALEKGKEEE